MKEKKEKRKKTTAKEGLNAIEALRLYNSVEVLPTQKWADDPRRRDILRFVQRAAKDFEKIRIAAFNRLASPVFQVNDAQLLSGDLGVLSQLGASMEYMEMSIKGGLEPLVKQSAIGRWLMAQKGIGPWLAAYLMSEFPDVYDAAICLRCGTHLKRQVDGTYVHPVLPKKDRHVFAPAEAGSEWVDEEEILNKAGEPSGVFTEEFDPAKYVDPIEPNTCPCQGFTLPPVQYRMHEKKPSTFVRFAGLATEKGYVCPECNYNLYYDSRAKEWKHANYTKPLEGYKKCVLNATTWVEDNDYTVPYYVDKTITEKVEAQLRREAKENVECEKQNSPDDVDALTEDQWYEKLCESYEGVRYEAVEKMMSAKRRKDEKMHYHSALRAKFLGTQGIADQFVMHGHPVYRKLYDNHKNYLRQRDPWRPAGHIDRMAKRYICYRFICDFFIQWRTYEGLTVRQPYEVEKLGKVHHF